MATYLLGFGAGFLLLRWFVLTMAVFLHVMGTVLHVAHALDVLALPLV